MVTTQDQILASFKGNVHSVREHSHRLHKLKLLPLLHLLDLEDVLQRRVVKDLPVFTHLRVGLQHRFL